MTLVEPGGEVVAAITHDPALDDEPELIDAVVSAAGFPLLNQRLQAELRGQYTFLETVADTAPSLLITVDLEGRIVNQNRATVRASGYDDEEQLRGRPFWDILIDPSERADVIARFEAAAPNHPPAEYENTFTNVRGETLVVLWRSAPLHGPDGRIAGIVAGGLDITETHRQTAAREQERVFRNAILNNAPSLLCLIDEHGVLEPSATNVAFEETLEYLPDETGGAVFWERYVVPEEADEVERRIRGVVAGDRMASTDTTWLTKSGRRLSVAWSCTRLPSIDGRRLLLVSGVDVTERSRREVELARERDATTTVLEATPSTIAVLGRDGAIRDRDVGNPRAAVNRAFREALGWRDEQLVGRSFLELVAEDGAQAAAAIAEAASGSSSAAIETDLLRADGTRVPFSWRASPVVDVTGRTDGLVLVSGADISERRAREREAELRVAFINAMTAAIPSYLIVTHADATIRPDGVNAAFEATFGWTAEEIAGESFVGQVAPSTDSAARRLIATAASGIPQGEIESRWDSRDGDSRIVAWTARPVTGMHGERLVLVAGADVTVRRIQEEEIRASRARLVQASDETRQRLERNLHDGAQQRLVALAVSLRLAESKIATDPDDRDIAPGRRPGRALRGALRPSRARTRHPSGHPHRPWPSGCARRARPASHCSPRARGHGAPAPTGSRSGGLLRGRRVSRRTCRSMRRQAGHASASASARTVSSSRSQTTAWAAPPRHTARAFVASPTVWPRSTAPCRSRAHSASERALRRRSRCDRSSRLPLRRHAYTQPVIEETGTVTFLLCDVEGSTALVHSAGTDYPELIRITRVVLRDSVARHGGTEIDAHGDELFAVFADAESAAAAAVSGQRSLIEQEWPGGHEVRMRMGLHSGHAIVTEDGYTGVAVHRAARVGAAGHGGQILVSETTAAALPASQLRDLGTHRLAGLPQPEQIHQLLADGLPRDFPPLRNTVAMLGNADEGRHRRGLGAPARRRRASARRGRIRRRRPSRTTPTDLLRHVAMHRPDVAIVDIKMPPTHTDEGLVAARTIRAEHRGDRRPRPLAVRRGRLRARPALGQRGRRRLPPQGSRLRPRRVRERGAPGRRRWLRPRSGGRQRTARQATRRRSRSTSSRRASAR